MSLLFYFEIKANPKFFEEADKNYKTSRRNKLQMLDSWNIWNFLLYDSNPKLDYTFF